MRRNKAIIALIELLSWNIALKQAVVDKGNLGRVEEKRDGEG